MVSELTAIVFMPVRAVMTAAPPRISIALTMMLVRKQKKKKTRCAAFPQRACTISRTVCAEGAFILICTARIPNRMIWIVAPPAYQKGPATPYWYAWLELCNSVAAQVQ